MAAPMVRVVLTPAQAQRIAELLQAAREGGARAVGQHLGTMSPADFRALVAGHDKLLAALPEPGTPAPNKKTPA